MNENIKSNNKKTVKGLVWGGVFSVLTQLVGLLFGIVLARLLTPSDYGLVGMLAIFSAIATLLQESGFVFVLTNKKDVTYEDYCTVFWFNVLMSAFLYCILFFLAPLIAHFFKEPRLISLSRVVFLSFLISSFGVVQSAYYYKNLKVRERGIINITSQVLSGTIGIILALNGMSYWGIALQILSSTTITTMLLWRYSPFRPSFFFDLNILKKLLPDGIKFSFPNLLSTISREVYSVVLGKFFTIQDVGYYNQATKFNKYGYSIILNVFRNVSQPSLVNASGSKSEMLETFRKLFRLCAFLTIPVMMTISLVSSELIIILYSDKWAAVGLILRIICIGGAFINLSTMFSYLLMSLGRSTLYMNLGIVLSLVRIGVVLISILGGIIWLALLSTLFELFAFTIYYELIKSDIHYKFRMLVSDLFPVLSISILLYISIFVITMPITNMACLLIVRTLSFCIGFLILVKSFKLKTYQEMILVVKSKFYKI